jgi:nitrogen fixation/metabolism regulation signal transduction histidine kinase
MFLNCLGDVRFAAMLALSALGSVAAAFLVSSVLQRAIAEPIRKLAETTHMVSIDRKYSVRAVKESNDEIGQLIDGFNVGFNKYAATPSS